MIEVSGRGNNLCRPHITWDKGREMMMTRLQNDNVGNWLLVAILLKATVVFIQLITFSSSL